MTQLTMQWEKAVKRARSDSRTSSSDRRTGRPSIEERFETFHAANPHVLVEMLRCARERVARGNNHVGVKALWEELRESIRVKKLGNWKLDNSLTSHYARKLIELEPSLVGVIETRRRKAP